MILITGPYFGLQEDDPAGRPTILPYYRDLFERAFGRGYSIAQVSVGGHGESSGCDDVYGPDEQADAVSAIRWAAAQPWSTGKVGTYGGSADGASQVAGLAARVDGHAAAVIGAPVSDVYRGIYLNGVGYLFYAKASAFPELRERRSAFPRPPDEFA